jgi:hypothetical protein
MDKPYASTVIKADANEVWAYLRDFGNVEEWLPGITTCEIEDGGTLAPGAVRRIEGAGGVFRERLLSLDDAERSLTYEILECPLPVRDYRATCRVAPVTDTGEAFVEWYASFEADDPGRVAKIFARGVFAPGLDSLRKRFG